MKVKPKIVVLMLIISISLIFSSFFSSFSLGIFSENNNLTIYRYEGFMGWGDESSQIYNKSAIENTVYYDWGSNNGYNVTIIDTEDANSLLTLLKSEKDNPKADVVIGLDNALLALAKDQGYAEDILESYEPVNSSLIRQDLIQQLDSNFLLTPVDYGALAFYYDSNIINDTIIPNLNSLTIDDLLEPDIAKQLILEDALSSSPGTGFLLWSIASHKLENRVGEWKSFWTSIKDDVLITPSWTEGFDAMYSPEVNRSILMSYATSP
ncbi:MAG: thiamine ABC transporter substrate-binding protein, partial [Candidatus Hodarchaeales archaeon]